MCKIQNTNGFSPVERVFRSFWYNILTFRNPEKETFSWPQKTKVLECLTFLRHSAFEGNVSRVDKEYLSMLKREQRVHLFAPSLFHGTGLDVSIFSQTSICFLRLGVRTQIRHWSLLPEIFTSLEFWFLTWRLKDDNVIYYFL